MKSDTCRFKIGDRVTTLHGPGVVKRIESWAWPGDVTHYADKQEDVYPGMHTYRYGVLHDVFPDKFKWHRITPTDNILYYKHESHIQKESSDAKD